MKKEKLVAHSYEIHYDIIISGDRYARTIQFPGYSPEDAMRRWESQRKRTNDICEYFVKGKPILIH